MSNGHEWTKHQGRFNIFPLDSYDFFIGMDRLDQHHTILVYHNKEFTCWDRKGNLRKVHEIPRVINVK